MSIINSSGLYVSPANVNAFKKGGSLKRSFLLRFCTAESSLCKRTTQVPSDLTTDTLTFPHLLPFEDEYSDEIVGIDASVGLVGRCSQEGNTGGQPDAECGETLCTRFDNKPRIQRKTFSSFLKRNDHHQKQARDSSADRIWNTMLEKMRENTDPVNKEWRDDEKVSFQRDGGRVGTHHENSIWLLVDASPVNVDIRELPALD
jgi:hypothetical protein